MYISRYTYNYIHLQLYIHIHTCVYIYIYDLRMAFYWDLFTCPVTDGGRGMVKHLASQDASKQWPEIRGKTLASVS